MNSTCKLWTVRITVAACCLLSVWSISTRLQNTLPRAGTWDYPVFISYAEQFIQSGNIYDRNLNHYTPGAATYKFPPLSGAILVAAMKAGITTEMLKKIGALLQLAGFFGGILWLTLYFLSEHRRQACALALCISATLLPTLEENLLRLQLEPALFFLLISATIFTCRKNNFYAGIAIGVATALKIYPILAVLFFFITRKKTSIIGVAISLVICSIFSLSILGVEESIFFYKEVFPIISNEPPELDAENISTALLLAATKPESNINHLTTLLRFVFFALQIVFYMIFIKKITHIRNRESATMEAIIFTAFIPCVIASSPNAWWNYQLLLAIPLTLLSCLLTRNTNTTNNTATLLQLALLLLTFASLHITSAITVDDQFYSSSFIEKVVFLITRIFTQLLVILLIGAAVFHHIKKARTISGSG